MEISPAAGKILGMLMAYGVSFLGLLLAYFNYRKRVVKGEGGAPPTPGHEEPAAAAALRERHPVVAPAEAGAGPARASLAGRLAFAIFVLVAIAVIFWAATVGREGRTGMDAVRHNLPGIAIPVVIFSISFWVTWLLYRHFAKKVNDG